MLVVFGSSSQAIATAATVAACTGEMVALDPGPGATLPPSVTSGNHFVVLPDGSRRAARLLVRADLGNFMMTAALVFASPEQLHRPDDNVADRLGSVPTLYAPATFAGWSALVRRRGVSPSLTGVLAGFPAVGDVLDDHIRVRGIKRGLPCGSVTAAAARDLADAFRGRLDALVPMDASEAELSSMNVISHGPLLLTHLSELANPDSSIPAMLYRGPELATGCAFAEAVDRERQGLGTALGLSLPTALEMALAFYGDQGMKGATLAEALGTFPGLASVPVPASFAHRYVDEDVVYGLAGWEALGRGIAVPTPAISAVVEVLEIASGSDLRYQAKYLANSFLEGLTAHT